MATSEVPLSSIPKYRESGAGSPNVEPSLLLGEQLIATFNLGKTGYAGLHQQSLLPAVDAPAEFLMEGGTLGPRADEGHPFCQDEKTRLPAEMLRLDS